MRIAVLGIGARFDLGDWERRGIYPEIDDGPRPGDHADSYFADCGSEPPGPPVAGGPFRRVADAIFAYRTFPPSSVEGVLRRTPIREGDTVGAVYRLLPGVRLHFAARVVECFDGATGPVWRAGFTYRTLVGHPELGEETFSVEKVLATGAVTARIRAWSRPGTWLARRFRGLARRRQVAAGRAAEVRLARIAAGLEN